MKKNVAIVIALIISMMCVCMLTACGEEIDTTDSTQEATSQEEISQEDTSDDKSAIERLRDFTKIKDLEQKNIILVDVYNEVANLAVENGWDADELTVEELRAVDDCIRIFNDVILNPTGVTVEQLDEYLLGADEMTPILDTHIRERVSVQYSAPE